MYDPILIKELYTKISESGVLSERASIYLSEFAKALSDKEVIDDYKLMRITEYFLYEKLNLLVTLNMILLENGHLMKEQLSEIMEAFTEKITEPEITKVR